MVPVLSEQITVTAPRLSTEESLLTMAFLFTNSLAPKARAIVTTAGRPSGTAEIARDMADIKACMKPSRLKWPWVATSKASSRNMTTQTAMTTLANFPAKASSFLFRGVSICSAV